jgi:hypothetical protein
LYVYINMTNVVLAPARFLPLCDSRIIVRADFVHAGSACRLYNRLMISNFISYTQYTQ